MDPTDFLETATASLRRTDLHSTSTVHEEFSHEQAIATRIRESLVRGRTTRPRRGLFVPVIHRRSQLLRHV